jgi:SAM-dependent methyltransferase
VKCNYCNNRTFESLEDSLGVQLKNSGFKYKLSDFETLNYKYYQCKKCGSSDRDRLYKLYFDTYISNNSNIKLLDFAPSAVLSQYLKNRDNIIYRSADLYMGGVDDKVDICDMSLYDDCTFDFIICSHILEHVMSDDAALAEIYRVLSSRGLAIIMTPIIDKTDVYDEDVTDIGEEERIRRFAQNDHVRLYEKSVFLNKLNKAGFFVHQLKNGFKWHLDYKRYAISSKSVLYIVSKEQNTGYRI